MRRWRLVHYNVKRFAQYEEIAATLEALKPDVVTLNEVDVRSVSLERLARRLGLGKAHFFGHVRGTYGNAVLCDGGEVAETVELAGGSVVDHGGKTHRIARGLLVVRGCAVFPGAIACTHLDHMSETERAIQARDVATALRTYDDVVLAADLNALDRRDYTMEQWKRLEARNAGRGWSPPVDSAAPGAALDVLSKARFRDLGRPTRDGVLPNFTSASHCPLVDDACQRIDYVHHRSTKFHLDVIAATVDADARGSDHLPLIVDFAPPPSRG
ncbi:hypothetical protein CTAYLR_001988 [Chrysophaeum taylorii]|uniref:Endonuclease/exonuclease/phosphatase domain-containing protein n=1 Tax=Chrysophaeum taylorii TaxID=2483200 RepID=A0AAD7U8Y9_9STRA|nr:hypothetical protein CTAYLR_001988 [Chrysophaeum taylorii]